MSATVQALTGDRWHLSHGPIDVVLKATGPCEAVVAATRAAVERFPHLLPEMVEELPALRRAVRPGGMAPTSPVGIRMWAACLPHAPTFVTAMAAVAGAVADELLDVMLAAAPTLETVFVNDGGDIALYCAGGHGLTIGLGGRPGDTHAPAHLEPITPTARTPRSPPATARFGPGRHGIATSGARGRSFSLGIADAVTVIGDTAAVADAAATLIANAVTVTHPAIKRRPAVALDPDSDLGERLVTVSVPPLPEPLVATALEAGVAAARSMIDRALIRAAVIELQGDHREVMALL